MEFIAFIAAFGALYLKLDAIHKKVNSLYVPRTYYDFHYERKNKEPAYIEQSYDNQTECESYGYPEQLFEVEKPPILN